MIANTYVTDAEHTKIMIFFVVYVISIPIALFIWEVYKEYRKQKRRKNHPSMRHRKEQW